jgi:glyoxylase-like metal-dependent hydrolase (beta-lactamase superfamily II)
VTLAAALLAVIWNGGPFAPGGALGAQQRQVARREVAGLEVLEVRPNFYLIAGAGAHVGVQVGPDGVLVVDTGAAAKTDALLAAIKSITDRPIRLIINTSAGLDHVGGNARVSAAGETLFNTESNPSRLTLTNNGAATIISTEAVLDRMSQPPKGIAPFPPEAWATEPFFEKRKAMYFNGEGIEMLAQPAAHSDGDAIVFFRRSDVVVSGEILDTTRFPVIDIAAGGSIQGEIDALNRLVELAIPSVPFDWRDEGTVVIPARGRVCDQIDLSDYRDMVTIVRDRIQQLIKDGRTLAQIQAGSPTQGFTRRYGADTGPWTTKMFVEAVYKSLTEGGTK